MKNFFLLIFLFVCSQSFAQKFEGLALTPPMGWNSWNTFQTNINEQLVKDIADVMVASGMKDAGYTYLVLDDGWMAKERDPKTGDLVPDPQKFPNGLKGVIDYVHDKGLKFGLYNCAGRKTCAGFPGTRGHEYQDARFYASLKVDYLKFDWCYSDGIHAKEAYTTMSEALRTAGQPIVFSLCEWGNNQPWNWAKPVGQLWRTTGDITAQFDGIKNMGDWHANGIMTIVDMQDTLRRFAGPDHWNDPDMLEVGNGMSTAEDRTHFAIWAMLAAPLMAGNDLRKMSAITKEILTNKEVIAINQDAAGMQGWKEWVRDSVQYWMRPLVNGDWAVAFVNRSSTPRTIQHNWKLDVVNDEITQRSFDATPQQYRWKNVWTGELGTTMTILKHTLLPHDVLLFRLTK